MITSPARDQAEECAALITGTFTDLFATVHDWGQQLERFADGHATPISRIELDDVVGALVRPELDRSGSLVAGAGFVVGEKILDDPDFYLAWWLNGDATLRKREHQSFTDYSTLEWWQVPAATGLPHITGPYIDYLCTEDYALTLTVPVNVRGRMIGMVGLDIPVHELERSFLARLRRIDSTATLINKAGRIIVSTDPHRATGTVLRMPELVNLWSAGSAHDGSRRLVRCGELNVAILID